MKLIGACFSILGILSLPVHADEACSISIDPEVTYQVIEGFGTSGAWWAPRVGLWDKPKRQQVLTLLYDREKGAGLSIHRYHIGAGGGDELLPDWRRVPCIETSPGVYDTSRDPGIQVAKEALATGATELVVFVCSPPGRLTVSGKVVADKGQKLSNLPPKNYQAYADYLCDIAALLQQEGLPISKFNPMNEPQWEWNNDLGEGVHLSPDEVVAFLQIFVATAQSKIPEIPLEVLESGSWAETPKYLEAILAAPELTERIGSYSVHSYWSTDKHRHDFVRWAQEAGFDKPLHMSEWCEMKHGRAPGMDSACVLAQTVISDLTICNVRSWCSWEGASPFDFRDALITVDEQGTSIETNKRLWALANFSRFIRPGWTRIEASCDGGLPVMAAIDEAGKQIACVVVNSDKQERSVSLMKNPSRRFDVGQTWLTSDKHDLQPTVLSRNSDGFTLPAQSVVTFLIDKKQ